MFGIFRNDTSHRNRCSLVFCWGVLGGIRSSLFHLSRLFTCWGKPQGLLGHSPRRTATAEMNHPFFRHVRNYGLVVSGSVEPSGEKSSRTGPTNVFKTRPNVPFIAKSMRCSSSWQLRHEFWTHGKHFGVLYSVVRLLRVEC